MERMESMEPISAHYTTDYPEIHPDSTYGSRETPDSQPNSPSAPLYDEDLMHKTILVGDSGVGKTSLLVQFDQGKFIPGSFSATVGIGFTNKLVTVDNVNVKLQIWDTAGQERFRSVTHAYYRDAQGEMKSLKTWVDRIAVVYSSIPFCLFLLKALLLLYDITSKSSFDNIRAWLTEIHEYAQRDVVIMLLGNKADMASERVIKRDEGEKLAREYSVPFMETSAKTGVNVELAFTAVAKELKHMTVQHPGEPKFQIHEYIEAQKEKSSCCSYF
ncbi:ras-related protein Rab-37-like [Polymixia lowei]